MIVVRPSLCVVSRAESVKFLIYGNGSAIPVTEHDGDVRREKNGTLNKRRINARPRVASQSGSASGNLDGVGAGN